MPPAVPAPALTETDTSAEGSRDDAPAGGRRAQRRARTRARIIETAMRLALEGGYEAVQMREVAERAEVSLATIYRHFPGKDVVLVAGLGEWVRLVRKRIERLDLGVNPAERLAAALEHAAASTDAAPVLMGALIRALATTDPAASGPKLVVESEVQAIVRHALGGHPSLDADAITRVIGHVWYSALLRWVGGMAPDGSVGRELAHAARLLVGTGS